MANFVNAHKVVAQRSAFTILQNAHNDGVLEVRTKSFDHAGLKHSFLQVEGRRFGFTRSP